MRKFLSAVALVSSLAVPVVGHADTFFFAVGGGGGFSGSGTLTGTNNNNGSFTITSLIGSPGSGVGTLIGPAGFNGNDNLLFPTSNPQLDGKGFAFTDSQGNTSFQVDIFSTGPGAYSAFLKDSDNVTNTIPVQFTLASPTPEPSSLVLLGTGVLGLAGAARRRFSRG